MLWFSSTRGFLRLVPVAVLCGATGQDHVDSAKRLVAAQATRSFTAHATTWSSVDVRTSDGRIAIDALGDIFLANPDGGTATPLLSGAPYQAHPRFSPDGTKLAYISDSSGTSAVYVFDLSSKRSIELIRAALPYESYAAPSWSPDGSQIAVTRLGERDDLVRVTIATKAVRTTPIHFAERISFARVLDWDSSGDSALVIAGQRAQRQSMQLYVVSFLTGGARRASALSGGVATVRRGDRPRRVWVSTGAPNGVNSLADLCLDDGIAASTPMTLPADLNDDPVEPLLAPTIGATRGRLVAWVNGHLLTWNQGTAPKQLSLRVPFRVATAPQPNTQDVEVLDAVLLPFGQPAASPSTHRIAVHVADGVAVFEWPSLNPVVTLRRPDVRLGDMSFNAAGDSLAFRVIRGDSSRFESLAIAEPAAMPFPLTPWINADPVQREPDGSLLAVRRLSGSDGGRSAYEVVLAASSGDGWRTVGSLRGAARQIARIRAQFVALMSGGRVALMPCCQQEEGRREVVLSTSVRGVGRDPLADPTNLQFEPAPGAHLAVAANGRVFVLRSETILGAPDTVSLADLRRRPYVAGDAAVWWSRDSLLVVNGRWIDMWSIDTSTRSAERLVRVAHRRLDPTLLSERRCVPSRFTNVRLIESGGSIGRPTAIAQQCGTLISLKDKRLSGDPGTRLHAGVVIPGFIDVHEHLDDGTDATGVLGAQYREALRSGVTTVFDPAPHEGTDRVADAARLNWGTLPRVLSTGPTIRRSALGEPFDAASAFEAVERHGESSRMDGYVKEYNSGPRSVRQLVIASALRERLVPVVEGMQQLERLVTSVADGARRIEHLPAIGGLYDDVGLLLASTHAQFVPTLLALRMTASVRDSIVARVQSCQATSTPLCDDPIAGLTLPARLRLALESINRMAGHGVLLGAGDHGVAPGTGFLAELMLFRRAGLSRDRILRTATVDASEMLGLRGQIGALSAGAKADFVELSGDPRRDLSVVFQPLAVVRNGHLVYAR